MDYSHAIVALAGVLVGVAARYVPVLLRKGAAKTENKIDDALAELVIKVVEDPARQAQLVEFLVKLAKADKKD
jgi:hypothetical protein